eukprot:103264-Hanusia_phi.AAC.1
MSAHVKASPIVLEEVVRALPPRPRQYFPTRPTCVMRSSGSRRAAEALPEDLIAQAAAHVGASSVLDDRHPAMGTRPPTPHPIDRVRPYHSLHPRPDPFGYVKLVFGILPLSLADEAHDRCLSRVANPHARHVGAFDDVAPGWLPRDENFPLLELDKALLQPQVLAG